MMEIIILLGGLCVGAACMTLFFLWFDNKDE